MPLRISFIRLCTRYIWLFYLWCHMFDWAEILKDSSCDAQKALRYCCQWCLRRVSRVTQSLRLRTFIRADILFILLHSLLTYIYDRYFLGASRSSQDNTICTKAPLISWQLYGRCCRSCWAYTSAMISQIKPHTAHQQFIWVSLIYYKKIVVDIIQYIE